MIALNGVGEESPFEREVHGDIWCCSEKSAVSAGHFLNLSTLREAGLSISATDILVGMENQAESAKCRHGMA